VKEPVSCIDEKAVRHLLMFGRSMRSKPIRKETVEALQALLVELKQVRRHIVTLLGEMERASPARSEIQEVNRAGDQRTL
jgi:hypothetical protein